MNKREAFIFDLDGVIVDTAKYHFLAWKELASSVGFEFTEELNEELKGVSRKGSLQKILAWARVEVSEIEFDQMMRSKNDHYLELISGMDEGEILPGVVLLLDILKCRNKKIALGSASKNAQHILEKVRLKSYFEVIVDGTVVSNPKPDPEVFIQGAHGVLVDHNKCVVFEDSIKGIQAANTAGMMSIGIGSQDVLGEADVVFSGIDMISLSFLEQLM